ncbi:MAG: prolyl-tRNA synthetase associated domain-containing protein [Rhizobiaceae bacterium]|nr:prolyl-tRNA synthetase associated domain-containing protein [Rhizobiaceae bacterium]MCV0407541.1 prolyl-tRNA synthetase associated domain-containing protein [Rhizobiaceae bacterium]
MTDTAKPTDREELFAFLDRLGISVATVNHPPLFTVEQSRALRGEIEGAHTKNLFLRDRKDRHFLLTVEEDATVDLKTIHTVIGASGRVSFGKAEALMELLGLTPGAVSLFGLINDRQGAVSFFIDERLMEAEIVNAHPLTNEATTSIKSRDIARFVEATGHALNILKLSA